MLTRHFSVFQIIPWNWKHLTNRKMQGKKVFWYVILHIYLCNFLSNYCFSKTYSEIKSTWQSIQTRKKLFRHVIVNNYLCSVSRKFLIKIRSTWRREIKEQALQLTLLYRGRTIRNSHRRCRIRKLFLKTLQYPQEATVLESIFKKVANL